MMKMKKLLCIVLALVMVLALAACGEAGTEETAPATEPAGEETAPAGEATYVVGICQLAPHPALDSATQGFIDALQAELGDAVEIKNNNAGGEANNCTTIIDGYISEGVDLILANATGALQAAASATADIPVLGTAVTNYAIALGLDDTMVEVLGNNISGTSDLAPLEQQAAMVKELFPDAETVGLLYCSAEPNSVYQIEVCPGRARGSWLRHRGLRLHRRQRPRRRHPERRRQQRRHLHPHRQHRRQQHRGHSQHRHPGRRPPSSPARAGSAPAAASRPSRLTTTSWAR